MKTIPANFPTDIALREGESLSIDGIARAGALVVTRVVRRAPAEEGVDRREAVRAFLERWTGAGRTGTTEEQLREQRAARLRAKHLK